jgi:hypothetical protein
VSAPAVDAPRNRVVLMIAAAAIIAVVVVLAIVFAVRAGNDDVAVPPLTAAEKQAGAVRVSYPDRSLPNRPARIDLGDTTVLVYFVSANGSGDSVTADLRVATDASPGGTTTEVTLQKGQSKTVDGFTVTLLDAFDTGDLSRDAADVTVAPVD